MSPERTDTTRLLTAAAVLNGSTFRTQVLDQLRDTNLAKPVELGLDVRLLAHVCTAIERRERRYEWGFVLLIPIGLALAAIDPVLALLAVVVASAALLFHRDHQRRYSLAAHFAKDAYEPEQVRTRFETTLEPEVSAGVTDEDRNLIVYRGFTPFAGAGISLGGWSFVINLEKAKEGSIAYRPQPFELEDLYHEVDESVGRLALDGLAASDVYFVSGTDIRHDRDILPDIHARPIDRLSPELARHYKNSSDSRVRHYRWYRIHDWGNELIVSQFFRCSRRGRLMFVEINRYLLTPLADPYRKVDMLSSARHVFQRLALSLLAGPFMVPGSLLLLFNRFNHAIERLLGSRERRRWHEIEENPRFDYGAQTPLRQAFSSDKFLHYFQKVDGDSYNKMFDREILDAICSFLDAHNIDTSDLRERQNVIMNSGIIVQGGDVRAESLAVGTGASSTKSTESAPRRLGLARKEKHA